MSETPRKPRVDSIKGTYYRKGRCEACGKQAERERTFAGSQLQDVQQQAKAWGETPIRHKKCEYAIPAQRGAKGP